MKIETLEHFLNKEQDLWKRDDIDKLLEKYGRNTIFYDTPGITNRMLLLFKYRDMASNDTILLGFTAGKNKEYDYVTKYISDYVSSIDFMLWSSEIALQVMYKILCERILSDSELKKDSKEYIDLKKLATKIHSIRYEEYLKLKKEKEEKTNESK